MHFYRPLYAMLRGRITRHIKSQKHDMYRTSNGRWSYGYYHCVSLSWHRVTLELPSTSPTFTVVDVSRSSKVPLLHLELPPQSLLRPFLYGEPLKCQNFQVVLLGVHRIGLSQSSPWKTKLYVLPTSAKVILFSSRGELRHLSGSPLCPSTSTNLRPALRLRSAIRSRLPCAN